MTYRRIDTKIWQDPWVECLGPDEKLLFVYFSTNECCNQAGLYQITQKRISFETGINVNRLDAIIKKLHPKIITFNPNWVWVLNFVRYQSQNESFLVAARREASKAPEQLYKDWVEYNINHNGSTVVALSSSDTVTEAVTDTDTEKNSSELLKNSEPEPILISIPLLPKFGDFHVVHSKVVEWSSCFPALEVMQSLREMRAWCIANPSKRKTKNGVEKFIVGWLSREQNKSRNDYSKKAESDEHYANYKRLN